MIGKGRWWGCEEDVRRGMEVLRKTLGESMRRSNERRGKDEERGRKVTEKEEKR